MAILVGRDILPRNHQELYEPNSTKEMTINDLPDEIIYKCLSFLPRKARKRPSSVCKLWHKYLVKLSHRENIEKEIKQVFSGKGRTEKIDESKVQKVAKILYKIASGGGKEDQVNYQHLLSTALGAIASQCASRQNHIVHGMIRYWKSNADQDLYARLMHGVSNQSLSPSMRLFVLGQEDCRPYLKRETNSRSQESQKGVVLKDISSFVEKIIDNNLKDDLSMGPQNKFQKNELVVIDTRGSLVKRRSCLFYAVIMDVQEKDEKIQYIVSPNRFVLKGKEHWLDKKTLPPEAIGKIPDESYTRELLPKEYKV